jgi:hypothetical protein
MKTNKRLTAVLASLFGAALLSGVALAGNPHGTSSTSASSGNSVGVKASSTTHFNTNAAAGSSATKSYGNGKTAGQIAMQNGASASTNLYGPGNSQPHKASLCTNGKTHLVDVHALKAHGGAASCASASVGTSTSSTSSTGTTASASVSSSGTAGVSAQSHGSNGQKGAFTPPSTKRSGGVAGAVSGQAQTARPVTGAANFTG